MDYCTSNMSIIDTSVLATYILCGEGHVIRADIKFTYICSYLQHKPTYLNKLLTNTKIVVQNPSTPKSTVKWPYLPGNLIKRQVRALLTKLHINVCRISIPFVPLTLCASCVQYFQQISFWHNTPTSFAHLCTLACLKLMDLILAQILYSMHIF